MSRLIVITHVVFLIANYPRIIAFHQDNPTVGTCPDSCSPCNGLVLRLHDLSTSGHSSAVWGAGWLAWQAIYNHQSRKRADSSSLAWPCSYSWASMN